MVEIQAFVWLSLIGSVITGDFEHRLSGRQWRTEERGGGIILYSRSVLSLYFFQEF